GTARELCSEEGEVRWRGEQGLWGAHREERRPIPLRRYLGDAANEEVYCELRYQGQLFDAETGLYYNRHRYFDPENGQYLSPDPIGLDGGIRPQAYVHNPLEWVDPLGLAGSVCRARYKRYKKYRSQGYSAQDAAKLSKSYSNPTRRPSYAKGQVDEVWSSAKQADGNVYDPNSGEKLVWDRSKSRAGQWDMGHLSGREYRKLHKDYMDGKISKDKFLSEYRDPKNYQPESIYSNRSHMFEDK
ncbi:GH-E family nuclease, partial [Pectobacterium brasiliense]